MSKFKEFAGFTIEKEDLIAICPDGDPAVLAKIAPVLEELFLKFQIKRREQVASFIGQLCVESGSFNYREEIGTDSYFTAYNNRADLGNGSNDGAKYKGRSWIQITGRANYTALEKYLASVGIKVDLINNPKQLAEDDYLCMLAAFWFFNSNQLWILAANKDVERLTRSINGGYNHLQERVEFSNRAYQVFGC